MLLETAATVEALLVTVAKGMHAFLLGALEHTGNGIDTQVEGIEGWAEGETDEVMAGRGEEVTTVGRVDVEEDTGDDDALLLEEEEYILFLTCNVLMR